MRLTHSTDRATYVWDTDDAYGVNSEKITVFELGGIKGQPIDAWGESISNENEFVDAIERREARQNG